MQAGVTSRSCSFRAAFLLLAIAYVDAASALSAMAATGSGNRTQVLSLIQDFAAPGQAGVLGTGTVDATGALDRALDAGPVALPCGIYRLDEPPLPLRQPARNHAIQGAASSCVTLKLTYPLGDGLELEGTSSILLQGMTITTAIPHGPGAAIHIKQTYGTTIRDVIFTGSFQDMLLIDDANTTRIVDSDMHGRASHACIAIMRHSVDTFVSQTNLNNCGSGVLISYASGIQLDNMDIVSSTGTGILVQPEQGEDVNAFFANQVWSDTSAVDGWAFKGSGPITEIYLSNVWASSSITGSGLVLDNGRIDGFSALGLHSHHNHAHGVDIRAGRRITIGTGSHIIMNGYRSVAQQPSSSEHPYNGINVMADVSDLTIIGVFSGNGGYMEQDAKLPNQQGYGLLVASSTASHLIVSDNNFEGNVLGGARIDGHDGSLLVHDNIGFRTSTSGVGHLAAGATCRTLDHGLSVQPDAVQLTPAGNWNGARLWVADVTVSTFQACIALPMKTATTFYWHASAFGS